MGMHTASIKPYEIIMFVYKNAWIATISKGSIKY